MPDYGLSPTYINNKFFPVITSTEGKEDGGEEEEVCYSAACLIPILKAVLEKAASEQLQLDFPQQLASLALSNSPNFSARFRQLNSDDKWKSWMDEKVSLLTFLRDIRLSIIVNSIRIFLGMSGIFRIFSVFSNSLMEFPES